MPTSHELKQPYSEVRGRDSVPSPSGDQRKSPQERGRRSRLRQLQLWTGANHFRELWTWARCKRLVHPSVSELSKALAALDSSSQRIEAANDSEAPIFLLANGWRTGSTLLQRILVTDQRLLLWGEPFGEMTMISALAEILTRLSTFPDLKKYCAGDDLISSSETSAAMAKSWIATLYPTGADLRAAVRSLLSESLGRPATERGFSRWGLQRS
jgi:hypothetical protein